MPGDTHISLGRYRLLEELGRGGMGVVYRAAVSGPGGFSREVVVKRVLPELSRDSKFIQMLVAEARLSALLHHPGIVQVYELGESEGEYFLVMEHVSGVTLQALLHRCRELGRKLPDSVVCYLLGELAGALSYAHELADHDGAPLAIVHRDISPSNIMVTRVGSVKLLDFGIAKAIHQVRDESTRSGTLRGKVSYFSPEQANGADLDQRSDVFALGIILFEALTLQRLFHGLNHLDTLRLVREAKIPPLSELAASPDLETILVRMLAPRREDRFQTCREITAELKPIIHRLEGDADGLRSVLEELGPIATSVTTPFPDEPRRETVSEVIGQPTVIERKRPSPVVAVRPRARIAMIGIAAAATIAAGLWLVSTSRGEGSSSHPATPIRPSLTPPVLAAAPLAPEPAPSAIAADAPADDGSATIASPVVVRTNPPGARAIIDGKQRGRTPLVVRDHLPFTVELDHPGFRSIREVVTTPGEVRFKLVRLPRAESPAPPRPRPKEPLD